VSRLKAQPMIRTFSYNGLTLPDIDVNRTPEQIRDLYSATYPEITTAVIEGPEAVDGVLRYKLTRAVGTKG
jgi:PRTRC genetic system protein C